MCFVLIAYKTHPNFPLIIAANRDEFYQRPARSAHWWGNHPAMLAGRDEVGGGTWFGVRRDGRFATVTNYRAPQRIRVDAPSRGDLVKRVLETDNPLSAITDALIPTAHQYNPFNFLYGNLDALFYFNNHQSFHEQLLPGVYGLGNASLDTPWPKLVSGKSSFCTLLGKSEVDINGLFEMMSDRDIYADDLLPDTGIGLERERALSAIFIESADYGTRCTTVFFITRDGAAYFEERNHAGAYRGDPSPAFKFDVG